jgi:hypothetical protein
MNAIKLLSLGLPLTLALGCSEVVNGPASSVPGANTPNGGVTGPQTPVNNPSAVELLPGPAAEITKAPPSAEAGNRERRRLDLDMLKQTLIDATGESWTADRNGVEINRYDELAITLGKPDYDKTTSEELAATTMFQRFLDDASREVCQKMFRSEITRAPADRLFFRHAQRTDSYRTNSEGVERNLQMLVLRFHGREFARGSEDLQPWVWLFNEAETEAGNSETAWFTTCVTLITHPDFYTF